MADRFTVITDIPALLEGVFDPFEVSLDGGQTWRSSTQEVLANQPFIIRVHYHVTDPGMRIWLVFWKTMLLNGAVYSEPSIVAKADFTAGGGNYHWGHFDYSFPAGISGQWGLKVDMYGGTSPDPHIQSLLKSQTFNPVVIVRPAAGFWVWEKNYGNDDLPNDGTRPFDLAPIIGLDDLPAELQSGQSFRPHFWVWYWSQYAFATINLKLLFNDKVVRNWDYSTSGMSGLAPKWSWRKYGFAFYLDLPQIESILGHVPDKDELQRLTLRVVITAQARPSSVWTGQPIIQHQSPIRYWDVQIIVPQVQMSNVAFSDSDTILKGTPFNISLLALFQPTVKDVVYFEDYVEAEYLGMRKRLWTMPQEGMPIYLVEKYRQLRLSWQSISIPNVDIESILGPVTQSARYAISLFCGTVATGKIAGTNVEWQRVSEAGVALNPYVAITAPIPDLLDQPESLFPLFGSINVDEVTQVIIGLENYGAEGDVYLDLNGVEVWRKKLGYLQKGFWDSGLKTIGEILGQTITESQEVQLNFVYGFIDSTGQKIPSPARRFPVYVRVPAAPAALSGYVRDHAGKLIDGAIVVVGDQGATTAFGYYHVTNLVPQLYGFSCEKQGYQTYLSVVPIVAGENRRDVTLSPEAVPSKFPVVAVAIGLTGVVISAIAIASARRGHGK